MWIAFNSTKIFTITQVIRIFAPVICTSVQLFL